MARPRIYPTAADRQRAYRARLASSPQRASMSSETRTRRPPSRPARLAALAEGVQELADEYGAWLDALPDVLQDSNQADRLREAIEQLEEAAVMLGQIDLPRGFGRDL